MKYVITGGSSGLGFQLAKRCIRFGDVISISRNPGNLEQLQDTNYTAKHYSYDFAGGESSPTRLAESIYHKELEGKECKLILNAAQFLIQDVNHMTDQSRRLFEINYFSQIELLQAFSLKGLKRVMFINSISGTEGQRNQFQYSSSKHALQGFVESLFESADQFDFDVINVNPGGMKTELWHQQNIESKKHDRFFDPEDIADLLMNFVEFPGKLFVKRFEILPESDVNR